MILRPLIALLVGVLAGGAGRWAGDVLLATVVAGQWQTDALLDRLTFLPDPVRDVTFLAGSVLFAPVVLAALAESAHASRRARTLGAIALIGGAVFAFVAAPAPVATLYPGALLAGAIALAILPQRWATATAVFAASAFTVAVLLTDEWATGPIGAGELLLPGAPWAVLVTALTAVMGVGLIFHAWVGPRQAKRDTTAEPKP